jgi:hypothetical protein
MIRRLGGNDIRGNLAEHPISDPLKAILSFCDKDVLTSAKLMVQPDERPSLGVAFEESATLLKDRYPLSSLAAQRNSALLSAGALQPYRRSFIEIRRLHGIPKSVLARSAPHPECLKSEMSED